VSEATSNAARADALARLVRAGLAGDGSVVTEVCDPSVTAWGPAASASSAAELAAELARRDDAFSDVVVDVTPLDVGGDHACVEWQATMTHTGPIALGDGAALDATGLRITVNGMAVAEFHRGRICAVRQYWDQMSVLEQLGLVPDRDARPTR
jgi:hypothetical protein